MPSCCVATVQCDGRAQRAIRVLKQMLIGVGLKRSANRDGSEDDEEEDESDDDEESDDDDDDDSPTASADFSRSEM